MASAATDAAERGRASARFDTCVEVGLFVVLVAYLVRLPLGLQMSDESALLYEAKRIRDGEVMYRDFFQFVTPLASYTIAGAYWLFGTTMATARATMAVVHGVTAVLLYASTRRLGVRPLLASVAALLYVALLQSVWPIVSWHWFATCCTVLLAWTLLAEPPASSRTWSLAQGLAAGLLIATQQQKGVVVAAAVCAIFLLHAVLEQYYGVAAPWRRAVVRLGWFAAGVALLVVPLLICLVAVAGASVMYDALVRFALENYRANLRAPWGYIGMTAAKVASVSVPALVRYAPLAAVLPAVRGGIAIVRRRDLPLVRCVTSVLMLCAAATMSIWYYPDFFHLAFIAALFIPPALLGADWALSLAFTPVPRLGDRIASGLGVALIAALLVQLRNNAVVFRQLYPVPYESAFGRVDLSWPWQASLADVLRGKLASAPAPTLFCYRNLGGFYLLTGGHNPTPYQYLDAKVSPPTHVQTTLDVLARAEIPYAVVGMHGRRGDPIYRFLDQHYHQLPLPPEAPLGGIPIIYAYERNSPGGGAPDR